MSVSDSIVIGIDALTLYGQISDPTLMPRWSPENLGATVADARDGAYVGMKFDGRNKRGRAKWTTQCTVTAADPGKLFEFRVHTVGLRTPQVRMAVATWQYRFEEVPGGTRVTETWTDDRRAWPDAAAKVFDRFATGTTFAEYQRRNIRKTLSNLKAEFEAEGAI
ncbi:MAG: SRPBCC family protein [Aeromicrobium sp.]